MNPNKANSKRPTSRQNPGRPAVNNFTGGGDSPKRKFVSNDVKKAHRIRSSQQTTKTQFRRQLSEVSPWISNVKQIIKKGKPMQKGFETSIQNLKRTKVGQIDFDIEKLHEEAKQLADSLRYIKSLKNNYVQQLDSLEDEIAKCQRYMEESEGNGMVGKIKNDENLARNLKMLFQDYRKKLIEARKELILLKRNPKFAEMTESQMELEEANMEFERLESELKFLKESYNFEEIAKENEEIEQNIIDLKNHNQHLKAELKGLEKMEEILEKEDRELKPLQDHYNRILKQRKQAKQEITAFANMKDEDESEVYLMEASRLRKEALEILELLGEDGTEQLDDIKFMDEQIKILQMKREIPKDKLQKNVIIEEDEGEDEKEEDKVKKNKHHDKFVKSEELDEKNMELAYSLIKHNIGSEGLVDILQKKKYTCLKDLSKGLSKYSSNYEIQLKYSISLANCEIENKDTYTGSGLKEWVKILFERLDKLPSFNIQLVESSLKNKLTSQNVISAFKGNSENEELTFSKIYSILKSLNLDKTELSHIILQLKISDDFKVAKYDVTTFLAKNYASQIVEQAQENEKEENDFEDEDNFDDDEEDFEADHEIKNKKSSDDEKYSDDDFEDDN